MWINALDTLSFGFRDPPLWKKLSKANTLLNASPTTMALLFNIITLTTASFEPKNGQPTATPTANPCPTLQLERTTKMGWRSAG